MWLWVTMELQSALARTAQEEEDCQKLCRAATTPEEAEKDCNDAACRCDIATYERRQDSNGKCVPPLSPPASATSSPPKTSTSRPTTPSASKSSSSTSNPTRTAPVSPPAQTPSPAATAPSPAPPPPPKNTYAILPTRLGPRPIRQSPTLGTLVQVPGGSYTMGSPAGESDQTEEGQHPVTLSGFWIMEREVTQGMWNTVLTEAGYIPSYKAGFYTCGDNCPMENVSWCDAVWFANELSRREGKPAAYTLPAGLRPYLDGATCTTLSPQVTLNMSTPGYRLPTEAEWEYAARGGESYIYAGSNTVDDVAWYDKNYNGTTHPGCEKARNGYGLCDMSGNVWEWVWDWYGDYKNAGAGPNPRGPTAAGVNRVRRGGGWSGSAAWLRVANRSGWRPGDRISTLGFRLSGSLAPGD